MLIDKTLFNDSVNILIFNDLNKALSKQKEIINNYIKHGFTLQKLPNQTAKYNIHKGFENHTLSLNSFKANNLNYAIITQPNKVQIIMPDQNPNKAFKEAVINLAKIYPEHKSFGLKHNHNQNATVLFLNKEHQPVASAGYRHGNLA